MISSNVSNRQIPFSVNPHNSRSFNGWKTASESRARRKGSYFDKARAEVSYLKWAAIAIPELAVNLPRAVLADVIQNINRITGTQTTGCFKTKEVARDCLEGLIQNGVSLVTNLRGHNTNMNVSKGIDDFFKNDNSLRFLFTRLNEARHEIFKLATKIVKSKKVTVIDECSLENLISHIVLVHAISPHAIGHFTDFDLNKVDDEDYKLQFLIKKLITENGTIGQHLNLDNQMFRDNLIDRPHMHWCWNQLVQPNSGGNWEDAQIAVLEPLSVFENSENEKPLGIAPYDTFTFGEHNLSNRSTILVPESVQEDVQMELLNFKGQVIGYNNEQGNGSLRKAIIKVLNNRYPTTWHICNPKGELIGHKENYTATGYSSTTCLKVGQGQILILLKGGKKPKSTAMEEYKDLGRYLGLHEGSITIQFEENPYFRLLKDVKQNHGLFSDNSYLSNEKYGSYCFAADVTDLDSLKNLGVLEALRIYNSLNKFDEATNVTDIKEYYILEAIYADLLSLFYKEHPDESFPLSFLDVKMIFSLCEKPLTNKLKLIKKLLKSEDSDSQQKALNHFSEYIDLLKTYFDNALKATDEADELLGMIKDESVDSSCLDELEDLWEQVSVLSNSNFSFKGSWPLSPELSNYVQGVIQVLCKDLTQIMFEYPYVMSSLKGNISESERYRLNVIRKTIIFLLKEAFFFDINKEKFTSTVLTNQEIHPEESTSSSTTTTTTTTSTSLSKDFLTNWKDEVITALSNEEITAKEIIDVLSKHAQLKGFYAKSAGVKEGYTVGEHTERVLTLAQKYRKYFEPQVWQVEWWQFLLFLALHDIGKGLSKEPAFINAHPNLTTKELELQLTQEILTKTLEQLGIRSKTGQIFQALLMYDSQGDYLQGDIKLKTIKDHLLTMSAVSELKPLEIYQLYAVFHLIDAASYPTLSIFFTKDKDSLKYSEAYQDLVDYLIESLNSEESQIEQKTS